MVQQEHPDYKVGQIAQELGKYWKALPDDQRVIYERRAADDKARYDEVSLLCYQNDGKRNQDLMSLFFFNQNGCTFMLNLYASHKSFKNCQANSQINEIEKNVNF